MSNIIQLSVETSLPVPVEKVLEAAKDRIDEVLVLGFEKDSNDLYIASSTADMGTVLVLMERAKALILRRLDSK